MAGEPVSAQLSTLTCGWPARCTDQLASRPMAMRDRRHPVLRIHLGPKRRGSIGSALAAGLSAGTTGHRRTLLPPSSPLSPLSPLSPSSRRRQSASDARAGGALASSRGATRYRRRRVACRARTRRSAPARSVSVRSGVVRSVAGRSTAGQSRTGRSHERRSHARRSSVTQTAASGPTGMANAAIRSSEARSPAARSGVMRLVLARSSAALRARSCFADARSNEHRSNADRSVAVPTVGDRTDGHRTDGHRTAGLRWLASRSSATMLATSTKPIAGTWPANGVLARTGGDWPGRSLEKPVAQPTLDVKLNPRDD